MTTEKTFLLGLGHQKCGTSWLHEYLALSDQFSGGVTKEYHIWDALDLGIKGGAPAPLKARLFGPASQKHRARMRHNPKYYFRYFSGLLSRDATITADITPAYSALSETRMRYIRSGFEDYGINTKAIILLRDPVARIKSAVRFNLDRKNYTEGIGKGETDFLAALEGYFTTPDCAFRTRYDQTITRALTVFDPKDIYVGLYENMFEPSAIERLSSFCGIQARPEFAEIKVNKTRTKVGEACALEARIRRHYADVYTFCSEAYPETDDLWSN